MFTGIITRIGIIKLVEFINNIIQFGVEINDAKFINSAVIGASIAINGVCLTIVEIDQCNNMLYFQIMEKTLERSNLSLLKINNHVNIEAAMTNNSKIDGHIVSGHVDGIGNITKIYTNPDGSTIICIKVNKVDNFSKDWIIYRGSITINGVSLTVAELYDDEFSVSLIPYTFSHTIFKNANVGSIVNLEFDQALKQKSVSICSSAQYNDLIGTTILSHEHAMKVAIKVGELGRITAPPNPWVGCIIVKDGKIIGTGYHHMAGKPHAEVNAINNAIENGYILEGASLYVTLEPCSHYGRTPPCCEFISHHNISEVYIAVEDPDIKVSGKGTQYLRDHNINVVIGVAKELASKSLKPYLYHRAHNKPYTILKMATSIDGKIAAADKSSNWITCEESRKDVHKLRSQSQAILVGINTCLIDNPMLNVRLDDYNGPHPCRVVLDTHGKLNDETLNIMKQNISKTIVFTSGMCVKKTIELWRELGISYYIVPLNKCGEGLCFESMLLKLGELGFIQLLVEGGSMICSNIIKNNLFNELIIYQGSCFIGKNGVDLFGTILGHKIEHKIHMMLRNVLRIDTDIKKVYC